MPSSNVHVVTAPAMVPGPKACSCAATVSPALVATQGHDGAYNLPVGQPDERRPERTIVAGIDLDRPFDPALELG